MNTACMTVIAESRNNIYDIVGKEEMTRKEKYDIIYKYIVDNYDEYKFLSIKNLGIKIQEDIFGTVNRTTHKVEDLYIILLAFRRFIKQTIESIIKPDDHTTTKTFEYVLFDKNIRIAISNILIMYLTTNGAYNNISIHIYDDFIVQILNLTSLTLTNLSLKLDDYINPIPYVKIDVKA